MRAARLLNHPKGSDRTKKEKTSVNAGVQENIATVSPTEIISKDLNKRISAMPPTTPRKISNFICRLVSDDTIVERDGWSSMKSEERSACSNERTKTEVDGFIEYLYSATWTKTLLSENVIADIVINIYPYNSVFFTGLSCVC